MRISSRAWLLAAGLAAPLLLGAAGACTSFAFDEEPAEAGSAEAAQPVDAPTAQDDAARPSVDADVDAADGEAGPADGGALVVFITLIGYDVTTSAAADATCNVEANGRLPGTFRAWFPGPATDAPKRVFGDGGLTRGPWVRPDGMVVAQTSAAFLNANTTSLLAPISVTATKQINNGAVWTGTKADGSRGIVCPQVVPTRGTSSSTNGRWTDDDAGFTAVCPASLFLYCFQVP